jgi:Domain of unknown function (DUF4252)
MTMPGVGNDSVGALAVLALGMMFAAGGCVGYRGPHGVPATIEDRLGVDLHREVGFKLGPVMTRIAGSIVGHDDGDFDLRGVYGLSVAVFEVTRRDGAVSRPLEAGDLGMAGWQPMLVSRSGGDQVLVFARAKNGSIRELFLVAADDDEVVIARLTGHLDRFLSKAIAAGEARGPRGVSTALGVRSD